MSSASVFRRAPGRPTLFRATAACLVALALAACENGVGPGEEPEQLLFVSARGSANGMDLAQADIYRANVDGTGVENLTGYPGTYRNLALSPDGTKLLFSGGRSIANLWSMNVDGTGLAQLTNRDGGTSERSNGWPHWSPDGTRILFASNRGGRSLGVYHGLYDIYVMNADGGSPRSVSASVPAEMGWELRPAGWTAGGKVSFEGSYEVNGGWLNRFYVANADGSGTQTLLPDGDHFSAAWSPDGSKVVFARREGERVRLYIANADGSGLRALTDHPGEDVLPGVGGTPEYDPWSPDGTRIAFRRTFIGPDGGAVFAVMADGSRTWQVTSEPAEFNGWSPDGTRIAFTAGYPAGDVYVIRADGSGQVNVTSSPADDRNAVWLPDS